MKNHRPKDLTYYFIEDPGSPSHGWYWIYKDLEGDDTVANLPLDDRMPSGPFSTCDKVIKDVDFLLDALESDL